jgi:protoporphyrinogen/coproporphyrinogen III oxidase
MKTAIVIGAGLSGLSAAWTLRRGGKEVLVLESRDEPGGVVSGMEKDGFSFDYCVSEMMLKSERMETLLAEMGLAAKMREADKLADKRYIVRRGRPVALPQSLLGGIFNPILTFKGKCGLLKEWTVPKGTLDDETVADFVRRRIGSDFLDYAIGPLVSGIYAGDAEKLSMRHAFPALWNLEKQYGGMIRGSFGKMRDNKRNATRAYKKRLVSFEGGMRTVPKTLAAYLDKSIVTGAKVTSIEDGPHWTVRWVKDGAEFTETAENFVIAIPAYALAALPLPVALHNALSPLDALPYSSVATVYTGYAREAVAHPLDGFGVLIPRREMRGVIGTQFLSSMFPGRVPEGHVGMLSFVGGMYAPQYAAMPEMGVKALVKAELARLLGVRGVPAIEHAAFWPKAIPHFPVGYQSSLDTLDETEKRWTNLAIVGNYRGGPASGDSLLKASERVEKFLR